MANFLIGLASGIAASWLLVGVGRMLTERLRYRAAISPLRLRRGEAGFNSWQVAVTFRNPWLAAFFPSVLGEAYFTEVELYPTREVTRGEWQIGNINPTIMEVHYRLRRNVLVFTQRDNGAVSLVDSLTPLTEREFGVELRVTREFDNSVAGTRRFQVAVTKQGLEILY